MATDPLLSVWVKVDRAKQHLGQLESEVSAFLAREPYRITVDSYPKTGKHKVRVIIRERIPNHWGGAVGDIVHNLRSSLDNLATALAVQNGTTSKSTLNNTYFPIGADEVGFNYLVPKYLKGVSIHAIRMVKRLKPYRGGTDAFRRLHDLDIMDKHTAIVPVGMAHTRTLWQTTVHFPEDWGEGPVEMPPLAFSPTRTKYPLKNGQVIFTYGSRSASGKPDPHQHKFQFIFDVAFGEGQIVDGQPLVPTLKQIVDFVERVVMIFARRFFPQSATARSA